MFGKVDKGDPAISWDYPDGSDTTPIPPALTMGKLASSSSGIVVAHVKSALQQILETARQAEQEAKKRLGRNAWVLALQKRSGELVQVGLPWYVSTPGAPGVTVDTMRLAQELLASGRQDLSRAFFYEAAQICLKLQDIQDTIALDTARRGNWQIAEITRRELCRLWPRHHGGRELDLTRGAGLLLAGLTEYLHDCQGQWQEYLQARPSDHRLPSPACPNLIVAGDLARLFQALAFLSGGGRP